MTEISSGFVKALTNHIKEKYVQLSGAAFLILLFKVCLPEKFNKILIVSGNSTATYLMFLITFLGIGFIVLIIDLFCRNILYVAFLRYFEEKRFRDDFSKLSLLEMEYIHDSLLRDSQTSSQTFRVDKKAKIENLLKQQKISNLMFQEGANDWSFMIKGFSYSIENNPNLFDIMVKEKNKKQK